MKSIRRIEAFRKSIQLAYSHNLAAGEYSGFDEILCFELHSQPVNPRMRCRTATGNETGLTFKELAQKWGISLTFLGELIADHCRRLEE
jgi:hypothetical protein